MDSRLCLCKTMTENVYCHIFIAFLQYFEEGNYEMSTAKLLSHFIGFCLLNCISFWKQYDSVRCSEVIENKKYEVHKLSGFECIAPSAETCSSPQETDSSTVSQSEGFCCVHKNAPLVPILRQISPVNVHPCYFLKIHFNIILRSQSKVFMSVSFLQISSPRPSTYVSHVPHGQPLSCSLNWSRQ